MLKEKKVYIIAPSSSPKNNTRDNLKFLKNLAFQSYFPMESVKAHLFHANTNAKRALFLKQAFEDKNSSMVWMLRGGYGFQKLHSVFSQLNLSQSKLFVGYSDGTALHLYLNAKKKSSLHAPTLSELKDLSQKELKTLEAVLKGKKKQLCFKNLKVYNPSGSSLSKLSSLKGRITGGNLSLISSCVGVFAFPKTEFLFLEDVNESAYKVDRLLHHLLYSGVFQSAKAILWGDFHPLKSKEFQKVLKSFAESCSLPFIYGLPCGHNKRMPLPFNTEAEIYLKGSKAELLVRTS